MLLLVTYQVIYLKASVKTAQNIVNTLGENAINDILTRPEILENVPSLPKKKQNKLLIRLMQTKNLKNYDTFTRPWVWTEIINGYISVLYG